MDRQVNQQASRVRSSRGVSSGERNIGQEPQNPVERYIGFLLGHVGPTTLKVPHEEEWVAGEPRANWVEFK